jgi:hypothetical protein
MLKNGFYKKFDGIKSNDLEFICYGIPRSGSTFIYQLICGVYSKGVAKTHRYCDKPAKTIASYRDFRDIIVSLWRIADPSHLNCPMSDNEVEEYTERVKAQAKVLDRYFARPNVCMLKYEHFFNRAEVVFSAIEEKFGIKVHPEMVRELGEKCSLESNRLISNRLGAFENYDAETHIHGGHIYKGEICGWRNVLQSHQVNRVNQILAPWLIRYGYD